MSRAWCGARSMCVTARERARGVVDRASAAWRVSREASAASRSTGRSLAWTVTPLGGPGGRASGRGSAVGGAARVTRSPAWGRRHGGVGGHVPAASRASRIHGGAVFHVKQGPPHS